MKKTLFLIIGLSSFINSIAQNDSTKLSIIENEEYMKYEKYLDSIYLEEKFFWDSVYTVAEQNPIFIFEIEKNKRRILLKSTYDFYLEVDGHKEEPIWISKDSFKIPSFEDSIKFVLVYKNDVFQYRPDFLKQGGRFYFGIITNPQKIKRCLQKPCRLLLPFNQRYEDCYNYLIKQKDFIPFFENNNLDFFILYRYQSTWSEIYTRSYNWKIKNLLSL
jgi:hypothetical protein